MSLHNPGLTKAFLAATAIPRYRVVKLDAAENSVSLATDVADPLLGVSADPAEVSAGAKVDVYFGGIVEVEAGGVIAKGTRVTVDTEGRVITPGAGTDEIIGRVLEATTAAGDITSIEIIKN